jgi:hypothetical protein
MNIIRKLLIWILGGFFLLYGLIRVAGGGMILKALMGDSDHFGVQDGADKVKAFMNNPSVSAIIPFSPEGYISYIILMGVALLVGTVGVLLNKRWGVWVMSSHFVLYVLLFLNFQVFNIKVALLVGTFILFLALLWLKKNQIRMESGR